MTEMFNGRADFSAIEPTRSLYISSVLQKCTFDLNEKGTEAAAATAAVVLTSMAPELEPEPEEFRADRPFLFYLYDKLTGMLLFQGRVEDPTA